jgi:hypothetical protein
MLYAVESRYEVKLGNGVENIANKLYYTHHTKLGLRLLKKNLMENVV